MRRKLVAQGIGLALLMAGIAAVPSVATPRQGGTQDPSQQQIQRLRDAAQGGIAVAKEKGTDKVNFVRASRAGDLLPSFNGSATAKATEYVSLYAETFGATGSQLKQSGVTKDALGTTVSFVQEYQGLPVFGAELRAHVDNDGDLTSVNGTAVPVESLSTTPRLSADEAAARAVRTVRADPPGTEESPADLTGIAALAPELMVYRTGLVQGIAGKDVLVYRVEVTNRANVRDVVFVDANSGKPVNRYSMIHDALERHLIEAGGRTDPSTFVEIWKEGDPFPGALNTDQQNEVVGTGEAYWFFQNVFGRDSYDGAGHSMTTVNNDGRINCPNANWNGVTTNYCNGVTSDDVVAHEWGHAYTEFTHNLIYQWQPGALNESYSDIWGETVDLINARMDEEEGDIESPRPVGVCSTHSPARPLLTINAPANIAKDCATGGAAFGPQLTGTGITGDVVLGLDADEDGDADPNPFDLEGSVYDGCSTFTNPTALVGKIVMVNRGLCGFEVKARNVNAVGGVAAVIANRDPLPITMSGDAAPDPTIPSVSINRDDRALIATAIEGSGATVNVTMRDASGDRVDSYKWLMGEDATAFGGAIRDMWSPTCYGDPGKVSDAEYFCSTDDGGGVHSNSGVPNHGYALLVDGGDYNGQSVTGIGLDKSAAIYFRAMTRYQTVFTDFEDHANSLESSCADLTGTQVNALTVTPNATPTVAGTITADDCASVSAMIAAVELRTEPVQCNFQPMFDFDVPPLCAAGSKQNVVWRENFSDGLAGWSTAQQIRFAGGFAAPWEAVASGPKEHASAAAFAPGPDQGNCSGGAGDFSSSDSLISPAISLPGAGFKTPWLTFDHYMATEPGFDGGNVKVSINGGAWTLPPAGAYTFNAPAGNLTSAAAGNTNPLAGQAGFTGTDGGEPTGSWGQSHVDLAAAGAKPGDTIQIRFDFGRDGCGGNDGWYVDNVTVSTCKDKPKGSPNAVEPSTVDGSVTASV